MTTKAPISSEDIFFRVLEEITLSESVPVYETLERAQELPQDVRCLMKSRDVQAVPDLRWNALVHSYFSHPYFQLLLVAYWNHVCSWGFTWEDFREALCTIPPWPEKLPAAAVTLVPYLKGAEGGPGCIERTFKHLWEVVASERLEKCRWNAYDQPSLEQFRLFEGIEHKPGLRWEVINLCYADDMKPTEVMSPEEVSPHAGIFAFAALHPEFIDVLCSERFSVWVPGCEVNISDSRQWGYRPLVHFDTRGIWLNHERRDNREDRWYMPYFVFCKEVT